MNSNRFVVAVIVFSLYNASGLPLVQSQSPMQSLPEIGSLAWEVRLARPQFKTSTTPQTWQSTLERISQGYRQRWLTRVAAADLAAIDDDGEDPLEHAFLGIKSGARTLLVPEGMVMSKASAEIHLQEGDTLMRLPVSIMVERALSENGWDRDASRLVPVRIQTRGVHAFHTLHPTHAASASRLVSLFPLPESDWSEEERLASAEWIERLRKTPIDYVVIERIDRMLGVCQMVIPLRAELLSARVSPFLERHIDAFAAIPIEPSDRVTCIDSAMLPMTWLPWQARQSPQNVSWNNTPSLHPIPPERPKCILPPR